MRYGQLNINLIFKRRRPHAEQQTAELKGLRPDTLPWSPLPIGNFTTAPAPLANHPYALSRGAAGWIGFIACLTAALSAAQAQNTPTASQSPAATAAQGAAALKNLSMKELMDIEVTSVSRRPEKLAETASAIQVITQDDIRRSGATRLPEALRLATNLEVDQIDSTAWAISARGFNSSLANKMLVLIDGRTVYSPLFAGVFWDVQDVLLEDIDRIEVISGPGATLWGANAVNGVINILTRSAKDTQGFLLEGGGGGELRSFGGLRYGGTLAPNLFFRVYGKYTDRDSTVFRDGRNAGNYYHIGQGGFRLDWKASDANSLTLQGDLYESRTSATGTSDVVTQGGNVLGRWSHTVSDNSDFKLQIYFDQARRNTPGQYRDLLDTYDVDFQHRFRLGARNDFVWGAGYRLAEDNFRFGGALALIPPRRSLQIFSAFAQDEIALVQDRLHLTLGTKLEHNDYTGFELEPSARLAWKLSQRQTLWAAISRAIRAPSRLDRNLVLPPLTFGSPGFESEKLRAYEVGYRVQPRQQLSFSLAAFYNDYVDIRSEEQVDPPAPFPLVFGNGQKGETYGAELTADYRVTNWWRLRAGQTELRVHIRRQPGSTDISSGTAEAVDSNHYFTLRSSFDLPRHFEFDPAFRYVSRITNPRQTVPGYSELEFRLAWKPRPKVEVSIVGQNLLHARHAEFGAPPNLQEIERSVFGGLTLGW
jgi:iron complex outermembrane recepter protein